MNTFNPALIEAEVNKRIQEARSAVLPWFEVDTTLLDWLPPNGGWSIREILTHITLTSHYLLILIKKGEAKALNIKDKGTAFAIPDTYELVPDKLAEAGKYQAFPWHRPEHMDPRLHNPNWSVRDTFLEQMKACENVVEELKGGWGCGVRTTMTVNQIGRLDVYQYIVFLCNHALRHCVQMESVSEQFNPAR